MYCIPFIAFVQDVTKDVELYSVNDTSVLFDYRYNRNPGFFYRKNQEWKKVKQVHLYRGNPILYLEQDTAERANHSFTVKKFYKLDVQLRPFLYSEFGDFREPLRTQIGIAPRFAIGYGGMYGVFQWFFPIQNDFPNRFGFQNRPGELGVGYTKIVKGMNFFNSFVGTFINDRYGGYMEYIRSTRNQRLYLGSSIYYTGRVLLSEGTIFRERINYLSGEVFLLYRFKHPNLSVRLSGERFLREDTGVTIELMRQFGNTDIGFSMTDSENGLNARMFIAFSLGGKIYSNKWMQIRLPHTFRFSYDLQPNTGISERTRPFSDFFFDIYRFNLPYVQSQLN